MRMKTLQYCKVTSSICNLYQWNLLMLTAKIENRERDFFEKGKKNDFGRELLC